MLHIGQILMTIGILQFGVLPLVADLNRSHATNPQWPAHARFHVVTQVLTSGGVAAAALYFLWSERVEPGLGACIAALLSAVAIGAFFISAALARRYGGQVTAGTGVGAVRVAMIDGNVINFGSAAVIILLGRLLIAA